MVDFLEVCVEQKKNIVVSGGTGSGKTTLLNVLSNLIPQHERIVTIEDAAELRLHHDNLVTLEARPKNLEGKGAVAIRDLVKNALAHAPRSHRRRRVPRRRSARHAAGDEHRPRRLAHHGARQLAARCAVAPRSRWC